MLSSISTIFMFNDDLVYMWVTYTPEYNANSIGINRAYYLRSVNIYALPNIAMQSKVFTKVPNHYI